MIELHVNYEIPSANSLRWKHWRIVKRDRDAAEIAVRCSLRALPLAATTRKRVEITGYRKRLCRDRDNFEAGCKSIKDALTSHGLIKDDSDKWCRFHHDERLASKSPTSKPMTIIRIFDQDEEMDLEPQVLPAKKRKP